MTDVAPGYVPPVYPFDKLTEFSDLASQFAGGVVDLSIGTPCDAPPPAVIAALAGSGAERGYPASVGTAPLREAVSDWFARRLGLEVAPGMIAASIGSKEFVAGIPQWLRLRSPSRDTVLYPGLAYPTYEMGAILAGCRAVAVGLTATGQMDLDAIQASDAARALCIWVNSPGNPAGQLEDLAAVAEWGRAQDVPVLSDECYIEFTWGAGGGPGAAVAGAGGVAGGAGGAGGAAGGPGPDGPVRGRTILEHGPTGVVAVHSLSKRSNLAGLRVGFFAGDPELVAYLAAIRRHAGFMVPGPAQHAAAAALADDEHVDAQRLVYWERLTTIAQWLNDAGFTVELPAGGFYLWFRDSSGIAGQPREGESAGFALGRWLAATAGAIGSPGEAYGPVGADYLRLAVVQPMERLHLIGERLASVR